jgi:hypothetical protein
MKVPCTEKDNLRRLHHDRTWIRTKDNFLELCLVNWTTTKRPGTSTVREDTAQKKNNRGSFAGQY